MVYAQLDNRFHDHPKVLALLEHEDDGLAAIGLWTLTITWAHSHVDPARPREAGHIPASLPRRLGGHEDLYRLLVAVGLWEATPDGWQIHDFGVRQDITGWQIRSDKARNAANARWNARSNATSNATSNAHNPPPAPPQYTTGQEQGQDLLLFAGFDADGNETIIRETNPRSRSSRGTRLPEDWQPSPELISWARRECPGVDIKDQNDRFTDYWLAKAGSGACHASWDRTWKNWMRRARDQGPPRYRARNSNNPFEN